MSADLLCMGEPMLEFNQLPPRAGRHAALPGGPWRRHLQRRYRCRSPGCRVGMITALGQDMPGDSFIRLWQREGVDTSLRDAHRPLPDRRLFRDP